MAPVPYSGPLPSPREIYRIDLTGVVQDLGWNATWRVCVVLEVTPSVGLLRVVFGGWDHWPPKCYCVSPSTDQSAVFSGWMTKQTHFAALNVADIPVSRIIERIGSDLIHRDDIDEYQAVADFAYLHSKIKKLTHRSSVKITNK